jgi:hypothetical protein
MGWVVMIAALVAASIGYATVTNGGTANTKPPHSHHRVTSAAGCKTSRPMLAGVHMLNSDLGAGISFVSVDWNGIRTASDWREAVTNDGGRTWSRSGNQIPGADSEDTVTVLLTAVSTAQVRVSLSNRQSIMYSDDGGESRKVQPRNQ